MQLAPDDYPIIATGTLKRLRFYADTLAASAGLGIFRGPVGIGKTFAVDQIAAALAAQGVHVLTATARPELEGSIRDFINSLLTRWRLAEPTTRSAVETLEAVVLGYPFRSWSPLRSLLIIDEAQNLKVNVLEMLRGVYDMGDAARLGDEEAPAFGLMMVGNSTFLNRSGRAREASYAPLMSRVDIFDELDPSSADECFRLASALCRSDKNGAQLLGERGAREGSLRSVWLDANRARHLAKGAPIAEQHVRDALAMRGVK